MSSEWKSSWGFIEQAVSNKLDVEMEKNYKNINQSSPTRETNLTKINMCCIGVIKCVCLMTNSTGWLS
jgi:hypothetical protein